MILPQFATQINKYCVILSLDQLMKGISMHNIMGTKFGEWILLEYKGRNKRSEQIYLCQCKCGILKEHRLSTLKSNRSLQCKKCRMDELNKIQDLTGQKFGLYTAVERFKNTKRNEWLYKCICECGTESIVAGYRLKNGLTKKCPHCRVKTHGMTYTATFKTWQDMLGRCFNKNHKSYKYYGGRGITVCSRWKELFQNFFDDMGIKPDKLSLDRINNDGNYEPSNCRWATSKEQRNNQRKPTNLRKDK